MKAFIDNRGMFLFMREFMQIVGSSKELKLFMRYERCKLAAAVRAVLVCEAECKKPSDEVISLLFNVAKRKGVLMEGVKLSTCQSPGRRLRGSWRSTSR
jgi:hypothetical protein